MLKYGWIQVSKFLSFLKAGHAKSMIKCITQVLLLLPELHVSGHETQISWYFPETIGILVMPQRYKLNFQVYVIVNGKCDI